MSCLRSQPFQRCSACLVLLAVMALLPVPVAAQGPVCTYNPLIAGMFSQTSQEAWAAWIARLSGETPVQIGGQPARIVSRHNRRMFSGDPQARAFEYVREQLEGWLAGRARFDEPPYLMYKPPDDVYNAKNLVVDIPGATRPEEIVVLSAHLDSLSTRVDAPAPGADDNASGVAALLEAARIFRGYRFARTIRLIFFTGEEAVEVGSRAYLADHPPVGVVGAINLDMIAFDRDQDRCFELHVAGPPASRALAGCLQDVIAAYQLGLKTEIVSAGATDQSDQSSFWAHAIPAVLLWENTTVPAASAGGCAGTDANPYYHTAQDTLERLNLSTGFAAARAGIAATAALAQPLALCRAGQCGAQPEPGAAAYWQSLQVAVRLPPAPKSAPVTAPTPGALPAARPSPTASPAPARQAAVKAELAEVWDDPAHEKDGRYRQTQLILGEKVLILQARGEWAEILAVEQPSHKNAGGYPGWVRADRLAPGWPQGDLWLVVMAPAVEVRARPDAALSPLLRAPLDTRLPVLEQLPGWAAARLPDGRSAWLPTTGLRLTRDPSEVFQPAGLLNTARQLTGSPYVWGGTAPAGLDCSGFVYRVFHAHGIMLARDAQDQARLGHAVDEKELLPGDLIFYAAQPGGPVSHVAVYAGERTVLDASLPDGLTHHTVLEMNRARSFVQARRVLAEAAPGR